MNPADKVPYNRRSIRKTKTKLINNFLKKNLILEKNK